MSLFYMIATVWLVLISILDIKSRRVSVWLLVVGGVIVLPEIGRCSGDTKECLELLKGMLPGVLLLAVAFLSKRAGYGDGVVLLLLGIASKEKGMVLFVISLFLISIFSIVLLACRKVTGNTKMPYLPFLTMAWLLTINL